MRYEKRELEKKESLEEGEREKKKEMEVQTVFFVF